MAATHLGWSGFNLYAMVSQLGILTAKGQETIEPTDRALEFISDKFLISYFKFPEKNPTIIDGFFIKNNICNSSYEIKLRDGYVEKEKFVYHNNKYDTTIITKEKIINGLKISNTLQIPFMLINVYDNFIYIWHIDDALVSKCQVKKTYTKSTINGGGEERENMFIPLNLAYKKLEYDLF